MLKTYLSERAYQSLLTAKANRLKKLANKAEECSGLLDFTLRTKPDYKVNWHHALICDYLDRFVSGEIKRLLIFAPPRHGKSELVSRRLPAYIFGRYPDSQVIACSYGADLATRMNRDVQRIIDDTPYQAIFPDTSLSRSNIRTVTALGTFLRNTDIFEIVGHNGVYRSAGVGGAITGMGFNFGIIDDPIKNRKEANSFTTRNSTWEWFVSTFYTRQEKDAAILLTLTRYHMDDLAGRIIKMDEGLNGEEWTILNIPAILEQEPPAYDPREVGQALWPDKYDLDKLKRIEKTIGPYEWSAQYQQNPVPAAGGIFKYIWFEPYLDKSPPVKREVRFWDLAMSDKTSADYTAGVKFAEGTDGHWYIMDVVRERVDWGNLTEFLAGVMLNDGRNVLQGIEQKGYMSRAIRDLNRDPRLHGFVIRGYPADTNKFTRALPFAAKCGAGLVHVLNRHWTQAYLEELCTFTGEGDTHDDQVDASSGAYLMLEPKIHKLDVSIGKYA